ncbi:MAG: 6-bladed beta-propeller [Prolixibacteraceae bacterium]|nr:6-bladed beta-propeller [Prolixibacteraceae bacterium]
MNKYLLCLFANIFVFLIISCTFSNNKKNTGSLKKADIQSINVDNINPSNKIFFSELFSEIKIVPLETTSNNLIGLISEIKYHNDTIYIFDKKFSKSVFIFSAEGNFISKIGRIGKGVSEYIDPSSFCLDDEKNLIVICDRQLKALFRYKKTGEFVDKISIDNTILPHSIEAVGNRYFFNYTSLKKRNNNKKYLICMINKKGKACENLLESPKYNKGWSINTTFYRHNFYSSSCGVRYMNPFCDTIFTIKNQKLQPYIAINSNNFITENDIKKIPDNPHTAYFELRKAGKDKFIAIIDYMENKSLIYFRFLANNCSGNDLFYYKDQNKIISGSLFDDLTYSKYNKFDEINDNYAIMPIPNIGDYSIERLKQQILSKNIKISKSQEKKLASIKTSDNPVLFFYKFKKNEI